MKKPEAFAFGFSFLNSFLWGHCAIRQTAGGQEGACASGAKGH
jgi:hypothetical protein